MLNLIPDFEPAVTPKVASSGSNQGTKGGAPFAAQLELESAGRASLQSGKKGTTGTQGKRGEGKKPATAQAGSKASPASGDQVAAAFAATGTPAGKGTTATPHREKQGKSSAAHQSNDSAASTVDPGQVPTVQPAVGQPAQAPAVPGPQPSAGHVQTDEPVGGAPGIFAPKSASAHPQGPAVGAEGEGTAAQAAASGPANESAGPAGYQAENAAPAQPFAAFTEAPEKAPSGATNQPVAPAASSVRYAAAQAAAPETPAQPTTQPSTVHAAVSEKSNPQAAPATDTPAAKPAEASESPAAKPRQARAMDTELPAAPEPPAQAAANMVGSAQTSGPNPWAGEAAGEAQVHHSAAVDARSNALPAGQAQPESQAEAVNQTATATNMAASERAGAKQPAGQQSQAQVQVDSHAAGKVDGADVQTASASVKLPAADAVTSPSTANPATAATAAMTAEPTDATKREPVASISAQDPETEAPTPATAQNTTAQGGRRRPHGSATPSEIAFFGFDPTAPQVSPVASVATGPVPTSLQTGAPTIGPWQRGETPAVDGRGRQGQSGQGTVAGNAGTQPGATGFVSPATAGQNLDPQSGGTGDQPHGETPAQQTAAPHDAATPVKPAGAEHLAPHLAAAGDGKPEQVPDPGHAAVNPAPATAPAASAGVVQAMAQGHAQQHPQASGQVVGERHETSAASNSQAVPQHLQGASNRSTQAPQVQQAKPVVAPLPVHDSQIADQVVSRITLSHSADENRLTVTLHPKDLGEVKIEVVNGKDGLRAHLQTQNQQVQDALEKHLPRLREAFHQQGLKLQQLQVSCDTRRDSGGNSFQQSQQNFPQRQPAPLPGALRTVRLENEWIAQPPPAQAPGGRQGISLRI